MRISMQAFFACFSSISDHRLLAGVVLKASLTNYGEESLRQKFETFQSFNQQILMWTLLGHRAWRDVGRIKSLAAATSGDILCPVSHRRRAWRGHLSCRQDGGWDCKSNVEQ